MLGVTIILHITCVICSLVLTWTLEKENFYHFDEDVLVSVVCLNSMLKILNLNLS